MKILYSILVLIALAPFQAKAAGSAPFMCRGGGNLSLTFDVQTGIWLRFTRAISGYGDTQLRPGDCAWADRTLREDEPAVLNQSAISNFSIQWGPGQRPVCVSSQANWIRILTLDDQHFVTFQAYSDGQKLVITSYVINQ